MILLDTNVLVAADRTADTNHDVAARLLETLDEPLLVPPTVLAEVCYLLTSGVDPASRSGSSATSGPAGCNWRS
ncbi:type II toxin-antitoxin system VapC family toxin [Blastococcus brunescens]|uniref:Type II toxin-antitoxin system VapC family toxin n=1 Tax=Blastococcus brunescens TaxID=1564165 RepID=A0ABZ1B639_9ACTN|nr:type II toxin-antitoxin system VapC family toxin [Blastococcus sp. BMG 8361]WRL64849.1 type II toxin-antitoxin system VapC family toxin [Blastococcus sp. BMG 8361]